MNTILGLLIAVVLQMPTPAQNMSTLVAFNQDTTIGQPAGDCAIAIGNCGPQG